MEKTNWNITDCLNLDDDTGFGVYARITMEGRTEIAYLSCCEVAVVQFNKEVEIVHDGTLTDSELEQKAAEEGLVDVSVIIPYVVDGDIHVMGVNEMGDIKGYNNTGLSVYASDSISGDDYQSLSEYDLTELFVAEE